MTTARRLYLYGIALIALGMLVSGLVGLLRVAFSILMERVAGPLTVVEPGELRDAISQAAALALIGLVVWAIHWGLADRAARRDATGDLAERRSAIRKLFLYLVLLIGGVYVTIAASDLLGDLTRALLGRVSPADVALSGAVVDPVSRLLVGGMAWLYHARAAGDDRQAAPEVDAGATLRRWAVYGLAFFGLLLWLFSAASLLRILWEALIAPSSAVVVTRGWLTVAVAGTVGPLASGLAAWALAWRWSTAWFPRDASADPERRSTLRKVYLYLAIAVAVTWSVWNAGQILHEVLRAALPAAERVAGWWGVARDLGDNIATLLVFGAAWGYHAAVTRREAALAGEWREQASIRWLYEHLVALVGLVTLAVGASGTLSTLLDLLVQTGVARPAGWWQDRLSLFVTLIVVGLPLWVWHWGRLQREAAAEPAARQATVRRISFFVAFGLGMLTLLIGGAATLYQVLQALLGVPWTAGNTTDLLVAGSTVAVTALLLVYHLRLFRADAAARTPEVAAGPLTALASIRLPDGARWPEYERELRARLPAGGALEVVEVAPDLAASVMARVRPAASQARPGESGPAVEPAG